MQVSPLHTADITRPDVPTVPAPFNLNESLERVAHWLPTQRPIKDFIHHNTLHTLEGHAFHEAIAIAARLYGAYSYLPLQDYQARYFQGRITDVALDRVLAETLRDPGQELALRASLFQSAKGLHYPPLSLVHHGIRTYWLTHIEVNLSALVQPVLFRLMANFMDQGIARWCVARPAESLWHCVRRLVEHSFIPLYPFGDPVARDLLGHTPDEVIQQALQRIVGDPSLYEQYLLEMVLSHPGWSGMVRVIEMNPEALLTRRTLSFKEFVALELTLELTFLAQKRETGWLSVHAVPNRHKAVLLRDVLTHSPVPENLKIWHEAMELSLYEELFTALAENRETAGTPRPSPPWVQALFCIDDRECSLRRHLETLDSGIETFGAAGFFGIDFLYQGIDDAYAVAQCPVVVTPRHLVVESSVQTAPEARNVLDIELRYQHFKPASLLRNWLFTQTLGVGYAARLAFDVFRPGDRLPGIRPLGEIEAHTHLHLLRDTDQLTADGRLLGFSHQEMANRLEGLLKNIGLTQGFAPLVVVVAHGSSSVNNPHFAAYDCGACAGKPGAPNARAFAWMANNQTVRHILAERGIVIPPDTRFVPALHNTSRDEITYYDQHLQDSVPEGLPLFMKIMQQALGLNAVERCRWFELDPCFPDSESALKQVAARANSIFEPRPELNHSNNLYCVVGRRSLTAGLFMDRRAFLHSYDPLPDQTGEILGKILTAIVPVCGGINLEYLFSRLDNAVYGAGTKLPHNVIGLIGVANGVEGDLRTGLPSQMVEVHEPARLLFLVEQTPETIMAAIQTLGELKRLLDNQWVRLVSCHPDSGELAWYTMTGFEAMKRSARQTASSGCDPASRLQHRTGTRPVTRIRRKFA